MDKKFNVRILTPSGIAHDGSAISLMAPGELGYLGILCNHAPLITNLLPGRITIRQTESDTKIFESTGDGSLEVIDNNVIILADAVQENTD